MISILQQLDKLADFLHTDKRTLANFYDDLCNDTSFLSDINAKVKNVPQFNGKQFEHIDELRVYRCLLYLLVRYLKCNTVVETGVLHGFGTAFILLALKHNNWGKLISVDLPGIPGTYSDQGTAPLPPGMDPGWLIPDDLKARHVMHFGTSMDLLPEIFQGLDSSFEMYLHDSDHSYVNMMYEMSLAWMNLSEGGLIVCDNVEYNPAFEHLAQGLNAPSITVSTFEAPDTPWRHGILSKSI